MQKSMTYTHANTYRLQKRDWKIPFIPATKCDKISRNKYPNKCARAMLCIKHFKKKKTCNDRRLNHVTPQTIFLGKHEYRASITNQFPYVYLKSGCNCSCVGDAVGKCSLTSSYVAGRSVNQYHLMEGNLANGTNQIGSKHTLWRLRPVQFMLQIYSCKITQVQSHSFHHCL